MGSHIDRSHKQVEGSFIAKKIVMNHFEINVGGCGTSTGIQDTELEIGSSMQGKKVIFGKLIRTNALVRKLICLRDVDNRGNLLGRHQIL